MYIGYINAACRIAVGKNAVEMHNIKRKTNFMPIITTPNVLDVFFFIK